MYYSRIKKLRVSSLFVEMLVRNGEHHHRVIKNILPDNVRVIDIITDHMVGFPSFWFILGSDDWPELKDGDEIPILEGPIWEKMNGYFTPEPRTAAGSLD